MQINEVPLLPSQGAVTAAPASPAAAGTEFEQVLAGVTPPKKQGGTTPSDASPAAQMIAAAVAASHAAATAPPAARRLPSRRRRKQARRRSRVTRWPPYPYRWLPAGRMVLSLPAG